jgi:hypothetical protein
MLFIINVCIDEEQVTVRELMQSCLDNWLVLGIGPTPNPKPINIGYMTLALDL